MGSNCCIAAWNKPLPNETGIRCSRSRNIRHSPSWSFRRDSRTHIEDICDNPTLFSRGNHEDVSIEFKNEAHTENIGHSDGETSIVSLQAQEHQQSPISLGTSTTKGSPADLLMKSNLAVEEKDPGTSSTKSNDLHLEPYILPSVSSSSTYNAGTPSTHTCSVSSGSTSSRKGRRSFGYRLCRRISDSRLLKPLREHDSTERRKSFFLPTCNDLSTGGSRGESPDGWSMRMFSELVSSHRDRWSFDSGSLSSGYGQIIRSDNHLLASPTEDLQMCGICSKYLMETSPWSSQKLVSTNELPVAAILFCGHVYHAECLENFTPDIDKCDPPCPACTTGGKLGSSQKKAEIKSKNKLPRIAGGVRDIERDATLQRQKGVDRKGKGPLIKGSLSRPFWRRPFSFGSRTALDCESARKKSFLARDGVAVGII